jgi:hypothetical protein
MAGEQIPEAWIGWQVTLTYWNGNTSSATRCTLEAVNDRGIVVEAEATEIQVSHTSFYPWSSVLHIQKV